MKRLRVNDMICLILPVCLHLYMSMRDPYSIHSRASLVGSNNATSGRAHSGGTRSFFRQHIYTLVYAYPSECVRAGASLPL